MRHFTLGVLLILMSSFLMAQDADLDFAQEKLSTRGEIYFTFPEADYETMMTLNRQLSIDDFKAGIVYAYANPQEFDNFLTYGIEFTPVYDYYNSTKALTMATTVAEMAGWDRYPTHAVYEEMMQDFVDNYPGLCRLDTIGFSVNGWPIICLAISDNIDTDEDEPEFWWSGTMHGDETTGYVLLLRLADYLLSNYGTDPQVTNIVQNMEIYINPLANPDGTFNNSTSGTSVSQSIRANTNGIDLNRNFPTLNGDSYTLQPEIQCMMDYSDERDFVMSANTHGGVELLNFPWDTWQSWENINADHNWWEHVCFVYADQVEIDAPSTYLEGPGSMDYGSYNTTGVTHGADWYYAIGSRQDYMNYYRYIQEVTIEWSDTKTLGTELLNTYWGYNKEAIFLYMEQALYGLRGVVTDACTGTPLGDVKVEIVGHDKDNSEVYSSAPVGNYHRPIYEGTYDFTFSLSGYQSQTHTVTITNDVSTRLDIQLIPDGTGTPDFAGTPTSIFEGETVDFTDASSGTITSRSWTFEGGSPASSTDVNPAGISYATAGTYDVTLEIVSNGCTVSELKEDYITVAAAVPVVSDFEADQTTVSQGSTVNFTDLSTNNPDDWTWTFDGGTPGTSSNQNPSIVYNTPGTYDVVLNATNTYGGNTETKVGYIIVTEADLLMSDGTSTRCSGLFKDDGGDSNYSDQTTLTHTIYPSTPGSFVRLTFTEFNMEENGTTDCYDYITIYDGENTSATEIGTYCHYDYSIIGTGGVVTSTDPSGALTIYFDSDNNTNESGWVAEISCYSPTDPPVADFTSDVTNTCTGIVQFEDLSLSAISWSWDFGDGSPLSTDQDPLHTYTADGTYTVTLSVTNPYGSDSYFITDMITVDMPDAPLTTGAESCGAADLTLTASGSGTLVWYDAATGGSIVNTGTSLTENFTSTTSYYVQSGVTPEYYTGGSSDISSNGGNHTSSNNYYLIFTANEDFNLVSVQVNSNTDGDRIIELRNSSDAIIDSKTVTLTTGINTVELGFDIPAGTDYQLKCGTNTPNLWRNNSGTSWPYNIDDVVSITGTNAGDTDYYYYFYNWEIMTGDECISSRTSVTATINDIPADVVVTGGGTQCGGDITLTADNGGEGTIYWQNTTTGGTSTAIVSSSETVSATGTYYFRAQSAEGCWGNEGSASVTINDIPDPVTVLGGTTQCGGDVTLNASGGAGGTIYWQNTTTGGTSTTTASSSENVSASGTYYFRSQSAEGCWGDEGSADVTIHDIPNVDAPADVTACDSYFLPALTDGDYFLSAGGVNPVAAGYEITGTTTVYVYAESGTTPNCTAENSFTVTINETPLIDALDDVEVCDSYTIPVLTNGQCFNNLGTLLPAGTIITESQVITIYAETGTSPNCTAENSFTVTINNAAQVDIGDNLTSACDGTVTLDAGTGYTSYIWEGVAGGQNYEATSTGTYTVVVEDANGCTSTDDVNVTLIESPTVTVTTTPESAPGANDGTATANAMGGNLPYMYTWGPAYTTGNPITGLTGGIYCVTVEDMNLCTATACGTVDTNGAAPVANFSANETLGCDNLTVLFTDESANIPTSWEWDFGDGSATSSEENPTHTYSASGLYTVSLTVSNATGSDDIIVSGYIYVGETPNIDVSMTQANYGESDGSVTVSILGGGTPPYYWYWTGPNDFEGSNDTHTGLPAGEYCVTVTENGAACEASECIIITEIIPDPPVADFSADVTEGCDNLTVQFTDESINSPASWSWNFGNGDTSEEQNPQYTYNTPGTYTVTLTVTNPGGSDDYFVTDMIVVGETPVLELSITEESLAVGNDGTASVSITGGETPYDINWTGGLDTETISGLTAGEYCVTVIEDNGCEAYDCINVSLEGIDPPVANFTADETEACGSLTVQFTDLSTNDPDTWEWNFGDGSPTSDAINPEHTYSTPGIYTVTLTVSNLGGSDVMEMESYISVYEIPVLEFDVTPESGSGMNDGAINMTIIGGQAPYSITWSNSLSGNPVTGLSEGVYSVVVNDANSCMASEIIEVTVSTGVMMSESKDYVIYPNPSNGMIYIESDFNTERIIIYDAVGKLSFDQLVNSRSVNIDTNLQPGVYFVKIISENEHFVERLIIE